MLSDDQKLIDELIREGKLKPDDLKSKSNLLNDYHHQEGIVRALIQLFGMKEEDIADVLCRIHSAAKMQISREIETAPVGLFTDAEIRKYHILPVFQTGLELTVAFTDPPYSSVRQTLQKTVGHRIIPVITTVSDFDSAVKKYKDNLDRVQQIASQVSLEKYDIRTVKEGTKQGVQALEGDTTMAKLVDEILLRAAKSGASDIHIEPTETELMIRFRVDGVLQRIVSFPQEFHNAVVTVVKSRSGMDMFERLVPQDGRLSLTFADRSFDVRINSLPLVYGEKLVLRLLSKSAMLVDLENLGMASRNLATFRQLLRAPNGIILVTGPTGSGKTTTLYAALNEIKSIGKNVTTIENPVEYRLPLINQTQVSSERGLTFGKALRAILRQDPNIILVGEIRDKETGEIATEAAMTGHLVLSTLHTNDAIGAVLRLVNLGIESFWVGTSMIGVVAQRLVRRICSRCKEPYKPSEAELYIYGLMNLPKNYDLYRSRGCEFCGGTGYKGRIGIHELLFISEEMRDVIMKDISTAVLRDVARATDFRDMYFDGLQKALAGITTLEEVARVTQRTI